MPSQPPASRVRLYSPVGLRNDTLLFDSRLYNGFVEKGDEEEEVWVYKRPGLAQYSQPQSGGGTGQGVKFWKGNIYSVFGGNLYRDTTSIGPVQNLGFYTFSSTLGATPKLFLHNGTTAWVTDGTTITQVTDPDYPPQTVPGSVYLDGTMYVGTPGASLFGSDINDATAWDPLNFLLVQIEPEDLIAITKQLVYVIALKQTSTEVFYDAGNGSGSPLGPVQGSKLDVGCRAAGSVNRVGGDVAWVGTTTEGDVQVMWMSHVKGQTISTPPVERFLKPLDYSICWSWSAKVSGHRFYVVTLPNANTTIAFDLTSQAWYFWSGSNGAYLPICASTYDAFGNPILQHATNGKLYTFSADVFQDDGASIPFTLFTTSFDGGLKSVKTCARLEVVGDQDATSVSISWSDDDYQTFNTPQFVALNQDRPWLTDGSSFSQRAYQIGHNDNTPLRIKALDLTLSAGNT